MNTPPMFSTPGRVGGIAIGSGPKNAQDADRIANEAPMPTMKQFRMSYCSGLKSAYWQNTAARLLARSHRQSRDEWQSCLGAYEIHGEGRQHDHFAMHEVHDAHDAEQQRHAQRNQPV